ncbi:ABC transporter substrate-binding protein [Serratia sp. M24T3]|uniref:ABC transporter substrate-binding protein n=1 Tax=Serratia sp. M24T3 TaxID=932213 RepID=UPI00025B9037|nr:ABC transporter substrate-binding protein [Serratia sp. M24T3]EIC86406.1 ABC transporter periplasmic binding protein [Serratia sp. M24T3]
MQEFSNTSLRTGSRLRRLVFPLLMASALTACDKPEAASASNKPAADTPHSGGTLLVAIDTDPNCLDPQQVGNNNSLNIGRQLTDSLTDQDPQTGKIVPWLATQWQVSDDNRSFSFTLRDGVTFSDGTPFNSQSVKDNLEAIVAMGARSSLASTYLKGLSSIETPDAKHVVIKFVQPNAQFLQATSTMSLGFFANSTVKATVDARCQGNLVGTGPFVLKTFVHNQKVDITRRQGYQWPSSLAQHRGDSYLDGIEYRVVPESGVRFGSLVSGQLDLNAGVTPQDEPLILAKKLPIIARTNPGLVYSLFPNQSMPLMADESVRKALNLAIDRAALQPILSRYQAPASSVLAKTTPLYQDLGSQLKYDPQAAENLLNKDGWVKGADGVRVKGGQRLRFTLTYWQSAPFIELVQQQLRKVGIDIQLDKAPIGQVIARQSSGSQEVEFYNLTRSDPDVLRTVFDAGPGGRNVNKRAANQIDSALQQSSQTLDNDKRQQLVSDAAKGLIADGDAIPLVELATVIATGNNVHGFRYDASSRFQLYDTWLSPKS